MNDRLKIGAVSYLNTKPLVYGLEESGTDYELILDLPSRLADDLAAGRLDVALIPSIEYFQDPQYSIVSDACIGCRGPVWSVKLLSRVPLDEIRTLALDEGSRTSVALVRILLQERFGIRPQQMPLPIGASLSDVNCDAALVIGDRAMHLPHGQSTGVRSPNSTEFVAEWDLGDEWCRWSELPFVFAMWVARDGLSVGRLAEILSNARDDGLRNLAAIAKREAELVGLSEDACRRYLADNLHFYLGDRERRGLALFYQHAVTLGLAPEGRELRFDDCTTT